MRRKLIVQLTIVLVFFIAASAIGETDQQRTFYNDSLDWKISKCEAKNAVQNSSSVTLEQYAELNRHQAAYYQDHREELIQKMVDQGLVLNRHEVEHFLIKSYFTEYPKAFVSR
jgi:hypothetical protein